MSWKTTEIPGNSSLVALMMPFEGAITTAEPQPVAYCSYFFFSMSYKNIMSQNNNNNDNNNNNSNNNNNNTFQKPDTQN